MTDPKQRYGFLRDVEADLLDRLLVKINKEFDGISFLEIGVFGGGTVTGVHSRCKEIGCRRVYLAGVDFPEWKPNPEPCPEYAFYPTDSMDAHRDVVDKFNLLFVDGCHCVNHSMCDFLNYSPFVVKGGYILWHDTALPTGEYKQGDWPQDHSYAGKPSSVLGVREGLKKLGILQGYRTDYEIIEEIPSDSGLMGMVLAKKLKDL